MAAKVRILVVEQQEVGIEQLSGTLLELGYEVPAVHHDGREALLSSLRLRPDLILMDISRGGGIDGISAVESVGSRCEIPIIYLAPHDHDECCRQALNSNPWGYLLKPLDSRRLREAIENALQKKTLVDLRQRPDQRYRELFECIGGAVMVVRHDDVITLVNPEFLRWSGYSREEVENRKTWPEVLICTRSHPGGEGDKGPQELSEVGHFLGRHSLPKTVHVSMSAIPTREELLFTLIDVTEWKRAEAQILKVNSELAAANHELHRQLQERKKVEQSLMHQATHDPLTGLPNRALLFDRLKQSFAFENRHNKLLALLLLDLDGFKAINDTMGHFCGDLLLIEIAARLQDCMRQYDTVARLGGDEFVIILNDVRGVGDVVKFVEKIGTIVQEPFDIMGKEVAVTASLGVAVYPLHGTTAESLLNKADLAMYEAKKSGKDNYRIAQPGLPDGEVVKREELEKLQRRVPTRYH